MRYSKHLIAVIGMMMMAAMLSSVVFAAGGASAAAPQLADESSSANDDIDSMTAAAPGAAVLPTQVKNLAAANTPGSGTSIDLRWMSGNPTIVSYPHYRIYYGTSHNPTYSITVGAMTRATITDLLPVTTYYFQVAAVNASGVGPKSAEVSLMTNLAPNAPTWGSATPHLDYVDLAWVAPSSVGSGILYYKVYISDSSSGPYDQIGTAFGTTYTAYDLDISTTYYFTVKGVNAMGPGLSSAPISATTLDIVPNAAQNVVAVPEINSVDLSWEAPAPNGGSGVLGYRVYYGTETASILQGTYDASTFDVGIIGLAPATRYYFNVVAFNEEGDAPDATASAITPDVVPDEPTGVSAERDDLLGVDVDWTAPELNGGTAITGFMIFYGTSEEPCTDYVLAGPSATTAYIGGLTYALYYFNVVAVNAAGAGEPSQDATATPDCAPDAPSNLHTNSIGVNSMVLHWTAPIANGGSAVTGYRLYMGSSTEPSGYTDIGTSNPYTLTGLDANTLFYFNIAAINAVDVGPRDGEISRTTSNIVPNVPGRVDPTCTLDTAVTVTWTVPTWGSTIGSPVDNYQVRYRKSSWTGSFTTSANLGDVLTFSVSGLSSHAYSWYFQVRAHNAQGWGDWSEDGIIYKGTQANAVPSAPVWGTATPHLNSVDLDWSSGPTYYGTSINQYNIYYGTEENPTTYYGRRFSSDGTVSGLDANTKYYFRVTAVNDKGEGAYSLNIDTTTTNVVPGAPTITSAVAGYDPDLYGFYIIVDWSAPSANGGSPITGYNFYSGETSPPTPVTSWGPGIRSLRYWGLDPTTTYYFQVSAVNAAGEGAKSTPIASATTGDNLPGAPAIVSATPGKDNMSLVWTAPAPYDGSAVTNYRVYWGTTEHPDNIINSMLVGNVLTAKVTGLNAATRYYFNVVAINAEGAGMASADWMAYTLDILPGAPTIGTVTPYYDTVDVTWSAPAPTGGSAISNYRIYYSTSSAEQWTTYFTVVNVVAGTVFDLDPETTCYFRVAAVNGAGVGPQSGMLSTTTVDLVPGAPTMLTATDGYDFIGCTWSEPADNRGSPRTGYNLYWSTVDPPTYIVGTLDPSWNWATIGYNNPGVTYYVGITAVNAAGEGPMSNIMDAASYTTPGAPTWTSLTPGNNQMALVWNAPASDGYRTISQYNVYRSVDAGTWTLVCETSSTAWTDTGLIAGQTYYYQISAENIAGEGPRSATRSAEPTGYMLQLTSPNGGESWVMGSIHSITWSSSGLSGQLIKIELYKNGVFVKTISNGAPNTGSFRWTVTARTTGDYSIKISVVGLAGIYDFSNAPFHITSVVRSVALDSGAVISAAPSMVAFGSVREVART